MKKLDLFSTVAFLVVDTC